MKLYTPNKHIVAEIDGKFYVLDTGLPFSFSYTGDKSIRIEGKEHSLSPAGVFPKSMADSLTGMDISGFIGMNIISDTGLSIDFEQERLEFKVSEEIGTTFDLPFSLWNGRYIETKVISIGTKLASVIIDTGACISYLSERYISGLKMTEETYRDENPQCGVIEGNFFLGEISFDGDEKGMYTHPVKVGKLHPAFNGYGVDAFLGLRTLSGKAVVFDFEHFRIGIR